MTDEIRLLLIEDSDDDAQLVLREITRGGFDVISERVETPSGLGDALSRGTWDLVICDYTLPQFNALDALTIIKASGLDVPILIISGTIGEESAVSALKYGAHDFLIKGNLARLVPAIRRELKEAAVRRQHRQAQTALEKSEERFRSWIEYSSDLVTVTNRQGVIRFESHSSERLLGYAPEDLVGKNLFDLVHASDRSKLARLIQHDGHPNLTEAAEFRLRHRDGSWRDFEGIRRMVVEEGGDATYLINSRDITERKQRERELEAIAVLTAALRDARSLEDLLGLLLDETLKLVDVQAGTIWLYDTASGQVKQNLQRGGMESVPPEIQQSRHLARLVWEAGEMLSIPEFRSEARLPGQEWSALGVGVGGVGIPLRTSESLIGGLFVFFEAPRELAAGDARVLKALAEIGGSSVQRTILLEQSLKQLEQLAALRSIDMAISGSFDLRLTLNTILDQVIKQLNIDAADILLLGLGTNSVRSVFARGFRTRQYDSNFIHLDEEYAGRAAVEHELVFVEDLGKVGPAFTRQELVQQEGFRSYGAVPLIAKGRVQGVLEIFTRSAFQPAPEWREFLEALAGQAAIAIDNLSLFQELQESNFELALAYDATIEGWSHALDLRDRETEGHTLRVTDMTVKLAQAMQMPENELIHLRRGALLHDIGKMGVPDRILHKRGPLNADEWETMRKHPEYAFEMLTPITYLRRALDIPYCHHERWDGAGYPRGLQGELIPVAARIFTVVDVWDALTSDRPYRPAWPNQKALQYIRLQSGKHFDPHVVESFLNQVDGE